MDVTTAAGILRQLWIAADKGGQENICAALDFALMALKPPIGAGRYAWALLPDKDMTPFEHLGRVHPLIESMQKAEDGGKPFTAEGDDLTCLAIALACYHSILLDVHRERIKAEIQAVAAVIAKGGFGESVESTVENGENGGGSDQL